MQVHLQCEEDHSKLSIGCFILYRSCQKLSDVDLESKIMFI